MVTDPVGDAAGGAGATITPAAGSGGTSKTASTHPDTKASGATTAVPPDPKWFDASGLGGLLGVGTNLTPAPTSDGPAAAEASPADVEAALAGQDHRSSPSSVVLLGASLLMLLALVVGVAVRWWSGRSARYWPA
ncbi:MAG: hypothetical protein E6G66_03845 [Actinobacteria bacterium]|nr:MAG: hypothetical protein E6G66_03845 [Actinomycetota bacterium]